MPKLLLPEYSLPALVLLSSFLLTSCDPGITIHQTNQNNAENSNLEIRVESRSQFIGETWYDPKFEITNSFPESVTVTDAQLVARGITYKNQVKGISDL